MRLFENHTLLWLALALYSISFLFALWRLALGKPYHRLPKLAVVIPGFLFHTIFLWQQGLSYGRCPVSNLFEALTFIAWCLVALHLIVSAFGYLNHLTAFYMPIVLVVQLAAMIIPSGQSQLKISWLGFHASVITLGYASFGLAAAVGFMYLVQDRQLRTRRLGPSFMLLPPILKLEIVQTWLILTGFCLLTMGLLNGMIGLRLIHRSFMQLDIKLLWSLAIWIMYLVLLLGHYRWKINGRSMAWLSIGACIFVLTTFWLANALSQFHHY